MSLRLPRPSLNRLLLTHEVTLVVLLLGTAALATVWAQFWAQSSRESLRLSNLLYQAQQIRGDLYAQLKQVSRARLLEEPTAVQQYRATSARSEARFVELEQLVSGPRERLVVDYLHRTYRLVRDDMDKIGNDPYRLAGSDQMRMKVLDPNYEEWMLAEFESALLIVEQLVTHSRRRLAEAVAERTRLTAWAVPLAVAAAVLLLFWSWRSLQRGFVRPMQRLTDAARRFSQGELRQPVAAAGVAETRRLGAALNHMAGELDASRTALVAAERQAALGALVPVVAHNIRNPLASIRANAQLLPDSDPEVTESRAEIIDSVDRLARWVAALLSYLHPLQPRPERVELAQLVDGALRPLAGRIDSKSLGLERRGGQSPLPINVDVDLFEQALYGLLLNAVEASPVGSTLTVAVDDDGGRARVRIRDAGAGIPFQPSPESAVDLTPGPTTKRFGTGLGIPFAFKVCQAHGAELRFTHTDGGGTEVSLWLAKATTD